MTRKAVSELELSAIVRAEIADADGLASSQLSVERGENMDYYQGQPFGNEVEGRSQVVSSDVRDTIEWILPTLIRIFCSGENVVEFEPERPEDVDAARAATDYVNFIWNRDNRGFLNCYSWFKDALLQKNGVLKIWWDDAPLIRRERYSGLDDASFAHIASDPAVAVSEHSEHVTPVEMVSADPETGMPMRHSVEVRRHDLVASRSIPGGRIRVMPVPPEEFLISREARDIEGARFVGHRCRRTLSDLIADGYDRAVVERLAGDESSVAADSEEIKRNTVEDVTPGTSDTVNMAMRQVWVTEAYLAADMDGDGIAEMRKVVVAGEGQEILSNEAWESPRPFASLTPIIMPHRFFGLAVADLIKDIQRIKSTILRQYLDNLYLSNNQREQVIEANVVDPAEVLSSAPGRKIRVKNGPAVFPILVPPIGEQALEGLNYIDQLRENRTGVSARTQALGTNQLHDTAAGERMLMSAAMGKIELIARIFAETGVRDAFRLILKLVTMYQQQPRMVRLGQGWQAMNPAGWNSEMDLSVRVGIGMGDRDQQLQHALLLGQLQEKAMGLGLVTAENLKSTAELVVNALGLKGVERFFNFPPPGAPAMAGGGAMAAAQAKAVGHIQVAQQKAAAEAGLKAKAAQAEALLKQQRMNQDLLLKKYQIDRELALKQAQLAAELRLKAMGGMPSAIDGVRPGGMAG
jgi:hypothetical protein